MENNNNSLYNALKQEGYDNFKDENDFNSYVENADNRSKLYNALKQEGYDNFKDEADFSTYLGYNDNPPKYLQRSDEAVGSNMKPTTNTAPQEPSDYDSFLAMGRKELEKRSGGAMDVMRTDAVASNTQPRSVYKPQIENPRPVNTGRDMEEKIVDSRVERVGKLPNTSDRNILENYNNRYAMTGEGGELRDSIERKKLEVSDRLVKEYLASDLYKELSSHYTGKELDEKANEEFNRVYGGKIEEELAPMHNEYREKMLSRYGDQLGSDVTGLAKENTVNQVASLKEEVKRGIDVAYREWNGKQAEYESKHPFLSALSGVRSGSNTKVATPTDDKKFNDLSAAMNLLDESDKIIAEANKKGSSGALLRGVRDEVFDVDTWTMGITDLTHASSLRNAAEKSERGENLLPEEDKLLEAAAVNMATHAYLASDLSRMYKAGQTTGASIPFMLEFALNPVSGSGNSIAKGILKYGLKRFGTGAGKYGLKNALLTGGKKMAARLAGDAVAATAMTATTGVGRVGTGTQERMMGDVKFDFNEDGRIKYAGRENQMGVVEASGKSAVSTGIENFSEMFFNAFKGGGKIVGDAIEKVSPKGVNEFLAYTSKMKPIQLYKELKNNSMLREVAQRTQFHGLFEEHLEEVVGNLMHIPLEEMTLEQTVDLDNNIDILTGLAPTSIAFGALGLGGMSVQSYRTRKNIERLGNSMTPEQKAILDDVVLQSNNDEKVKNSIRNIVLNKELSEGQKKNKIAYLYNSLQEKATESVRNAEMDEAIEKEVADIVNSSNQADGTFTECNRITTNEIGEIVLVPGNITGWMGEQPLWKPMDAKPTDDAIALKDSEYDPASIQSMSTKDMIDATAEMMREEAQKKAEREANYSPEIIPPASGLTFSDTEGRSYTIVQPNPDGGWITEVISMDEKGNQSVQMVDISDKEYYDAMQIQIDAREKSANMQPEVNEMSGNPLGNEGVASVDENMMGSNEVDTASEVVAPVDESIQEQKPVFPVDEKGNTLYHKMPVEGTIVDLTDGTLDDNEIDGFIETNKAEAGKLLKKVSESAPKISTNKVKYLADKRVWQEKVADAQAQVDYWNSVNEEIAASRVQPGDKTAEAILSMGEPMNGDELAAMMLGTGRLPILYGSYKKETGGRNAEARGMVGLFASKANGGMSIEEAGEQLMLADQENGTNFFEANDPNAGRNAIIDVLSGARTRGDLFGFIQRNREAMAKRERHAELEAYEQTIAKLAEASRMTPEEFIAFEENIAQMLEERLKDVSDEELKGIFAELYLEENERGRESNEVGTGVPEGEERVGSNEGSSGILSEERSDDAGASERSAEQPDGNVEIGEPGNSVLPETATVAGRTEVELPIFFSPTKMEEESLLDYAARIDESKRVHDAGKEVDANPTEAQKEAGNYKKGHIKIDGFDITIENPKGTVRSGVDAAGTPWSITMNNTYGYIRGTEGVDGDHIDVFFGDGGSNVYVVDQVNQDGSFDEHKVMYGFNLEEEARDAYLANYSPGWNGLGSITGVSKELFKEWIGSSHRKTKPFAEYRIARERVLSEPEYIQSKIDLAFNNRSNQSQAKEEWEYTDDGVKAYNNAADSYSSYIKDISDSGELQRIYDSSNIGDKIRIRGNIETAGFEVNDLVDTTKEKVEAKKKREKKKAEKSSETMRKLGLLSLAMTEEEYLESKGFGFRGYQDDSIYRHPHGISQKQRDALVKRAMEKADVYNAKREELRKEYQEKLANGELRAPSTIEKLIKVANGMPDLESTQAARRALEKRGVDWQDNGKRFREVKPSEEQTIINEAKKNGTYMKAPNGKPTNLNEKQWVQVRTEAFKNWFGDWEKVTRIEKLRKSKPIKITGEEYIGKYELNRDSAQQWIKDNLRGKYVNSDTGDSIEIRKDGAQKVTSHSMGSETHLQSIALIPNLIESSVFITEIPNEKSNGKYDSYRYYVCGLNINGIDYTVKITVGVKGLNKYYDHALTQIEKSTLIDNIDALSPTFDNNKDTLFEHKDTKLISILQVNNSKVVDENGEPMMVYHGTRSKDDFFVFDSKKGNSSNQGGYYFSNKREFAEKFGKIVKEVFLDIKNPNLDGFDGSGAVMAPSSYRDGGIFTKRNTDRYAEKGTKEYIVFNPNQIKSATDNTGKFSTKNDDILYREQETQSLEAKKENIVSSINELSESLHTQVRIVKSVDELTEGDSARNRIEKGNRVKGWFDTKSQEVVVYLPHAVSVEDANETVLHEVVGHYGLRKIFGEDFDTFLDNVYANASAEVRKGIVDRANRKGNILDLREATEEYLAELAERGFENAEERSLWQKIKDAFVELLRKAGVKLGFELTDNELRYILWKSYQNLESPSIMDRAADVDMQNRLGVGEYALKKVDKTLNTNEEFLSLRESKIENDNEISESISQGEYGKMSEKNSRIEEVASELRRRSSEDARNASPNSEGLSERQQKEVENKAMEEYAKEKGIWIPMQDIFSLGVPAPSGNENDVYLDTKDNSVYKVNNLMNSKKISALLERLKLHNQYFPQTKYELVGFSGFGSGDVFPVLKQDYIVNTTYATLEEIDSYMQSLGFNQSGEAAYYNGDVVISDLRPRNVLKDIDGDIYVVDADFREITPDGDKRFRTGESTDEEIEPDGTIEAYETALKKQGFRAQEAYQDSMLALKVFQDVVLAKDGGKLKSFEDSYKAENRMSSVSTREKEVFSKVFLNPIITEVARLIKEEDVTYRDITGYLIAKHGLERNIVLRERKASEAADKAVKERIDSATREHRKGHMSEDEYNSVINEANLKRNEVYQKELEKNANKDYSGLTGLMENFADEKDGDFTSFAEQFVSDFESKHNIKELWTLINKATNQTLKKSYESGLMSLEQYESLKGRFKTYVPLRGWDETMADEVYEYLDNMRSPVNSLLKSADGRKSLADDPIATIGNMADSTILQGNRNVMKQNFLNFVINHPSDLAQVKDMWYAKDNVSGDFVPSFPNIPENATAEDIANIVSEHEENMKFLEKDGLAKRGMNELGLSYKILPYQKSEHIVSMKRNGKDVVVYINGNPRVAQALNGLTNPDVESNAILSGLGKLNRILAANFTTRNPAFVLSNLSRDLIFSTSAVAVKETPLYLARFSTNIPKSIAAVFKGIRRNGGTSEADKYFQEFLDNGGETGYANLTDVDKYKKMIQKEVKHLTKKDYFKLVRQGLELFGDFNRMAEDIARFNTYMTSRQEGRSVVEAINDAKEITVNFNKKGAGYKSINKLAPWYASGNLAAYSAGIFKNLYLFFNAGIQSLFNFNSLYKKNWKKFGGLLGGFTAAGFLIPLVNSLFQSIGGDGGDEDYYANLSEWTRRNNLCLYIPGSKGHFITIPLPIELRAFYGLGDMAYQQTIGNGGKKGTEIAYDAVNQLTELLPLNPLGNNGDLGSTLMPDAAKPIWQVMKNEDFTGRPIYKKNSFNEDMPEWTKTYKGTSKWLTELSEWSNELGGGDKYKTAPDFLNWNPAVVEHVLQGYFGGMATTLNQLGKTMAAGVESAIDGEKSDDLTWRNTPVLSRFINDASDERSAFRGINEKYYQLYDVYKEVDKNLHGYSKEVSSGNLDYLDKLNGLYQSEEYKTYEIFKRSKNKIDRLRKLESELSDAMGDAKDKLQSEIKKLKKEIVGKVK